MFGGAPKYCKAVLSALEVNTPAATACSAAAFETAGLTSANLMANLSFNEFANLDQRAKFPPYKISALLNPPEALFKLVIASSKRTIKSA